MGLGWWVPFQIDMLKQLSAHPDARATIDTIKLNLAMLSSHECSAPLRRLATLTPKIDAFSAGLILRIPEAWQITEAGRTIKARLQSGEATEAPKETPLVTAKQIPIRPQRQLDQYRPEADVTCRNKLRGGGRPLAW